MPRLVLVLALAALAIAPAADAREVRSGSVTLAFDNAFGLSLVKLGIAPTVIAPAKQDGVTFTLPARSGTLRTVRTRGGFLLTDAPQGIQLGLSNLAVKVRGKRVTLEGFASLGGKPYDSFAFATGKARRVQRTRSSLDVSGVTLRLSDIGSTALNSQFRTTQYRTGQVIGSASVQADGQR